MSWGMAIYPSICWSNPVKTPCLLVKPHQNLNKKSMFFPLRIQQVAASQETFRCGSTHQQEMFLSIWYYMRYVYPNVHKYSNIYLYDSICQYTCLNIHLIVEGSLEVKLPTIWTDEKQYVWLCIFEYIMYIYTYLIIFVYAPIYMHTYIYMSLDSGSLAPPPMVWSPKLTLSGTRDTGPYMHACMHASIHPSIHTYIHTHTDIHTYLPTYLHTYLHTYIPTYLRTYVHTYIHTCMHAWMHTYLHTYIHTYLHTYIPTYIPTYIHTYIPTYQHTTTTGHRGGDHKNHTTIPGHRGGDHGWGGLGRPGSYIYIIYIIYIYIILYIYLIISYVFSYLSIYLFD